MSKFIEWLKLRKKIFFPENKGVNTKLKGGINMVKDRETIKNEINPIIDVNYHFKLDRVKKLTEYTLKESAENGLTEYLKTNPITLTETQKSDWINAVVIKVTKILNSKKVYTKCKPTFEEEDDEDNDYDSDFDDVI